MGLRAPCFRATARTLRGVSDTVDAPAVIRPPRTVVAAFVATIAATVLSVVSAAIWWGYQNYLRHEFVKNNKKLKPTDKNFKKDYDLGAHVGKVNHDVHSWLTSGLIQSLVFGLALVLIAVNVRRGKSWARWLLLILFAVPVLPTNALYRLLALTVNSPALTRVASALVGLTGVAVIVLLFLPESSRYFAAVRGVTAGDRASGAAPPGIRGLFAPRKPPPDDVDLPAKSVPTRSGQRPAKPVGRSPAVPDDQPGRAKAKPAAAGSARTKANQAGANQAGGRPAEATPAPVDAKGAPTPKAKLRAGTEAAPSRPASSVASKGRGKSRKSS